MSVAGRTDLRRDARVSIWNRDLTLSQFFLLFYIEAELLGIVIVVLRKLGIA